MSKCREAFECYIRSISGFKSDFQVDCNGAYKSDLMNVMLLAWQEQQKRIDESQARVDAALKETQHALRYVEEDMRGNHEFLQMAMIRTFKPLAQALKGGEV